jgi:hypothetical protein
MPLSRARGEAMRIVLKPLGVLFIIGIWVVSMIALSAKKREAANQPDAAGTAPASASTAAGTRQAASAGAVQIANGSFDKGGALPDGWTNLPWIGQGQARLSRDTKNFRSAPASLRLEGVTPQTYTALDHRIEGYEEGKPFTIRGWVKSEGGVKDAQIAVRGREIPGEVAPQKEYFHVFNATKAGNWTPFESRVTLKPGSKHAYFVIVLAGQGKVWVDDITITP